MNHIGGQTILSIFLLSEANNSVSQYGPDDQEPEEQF